MSHSEDPAIAGLNSSARVLLTTVTHKLLPALKNATSALEFGNESSVNWADALNHYAVAAKQMDNLWQEIQPAGSGEGGGSGFDLTILTPVDSGHPSAEQLEHQQRLQQQAAAGGRPGAKQEPVYVGVAVPPLLSTMVPAEDSALLPAADPSYSMRSEAEEQALLAQIQAHNAGISSVLDGIEVRMEQWRAENSSSAGGSTGRGQGRLRTGTTAFS